ncbi:MAG: K+/H+ antiporter subunit F [Phycisphaera sp.]|nr:K+/H+ antiporter subunit F [Phycisphaera sp.]
MLTPITFTLAAANQAVHTDAGNNPIVDAALLVGIVALAGCMLMCVVRTLRGPSLADRALAVDTFAVTLIGMVILLAMRFRVLYFIDGVLVLSLLSFAGTVAMAFYIGRPHVKKRTIQTGIKPESQ